MVIVCLTCFRMSVNRTMLTWGTFSTQAPSVDIMILLAMAIYGGVEPTCGSGYFEYVYMLEGALTKIST